MYGILCAILAITTLTNGQSVIGYDCGGKGMNITRISLLEVGTCEIPRKEVTTTTEYIRLLQSKKFSETSVRQCKVMVRRDIRGCGFMDHETAVPYGVSDYLEEVTREQCDAMHDHGTFSMGTGGVITGLIVNSTVYRSIILAGEIEFNQDCEGTQYATALGTYKDVTVQAALTITLTSYTAKSDRDKNVLHLNSGVNCKLDKNTCLDNTGGNTFWTNVPIDQCSFEDYDVIYEGPASKIVTLESSAKPIYSVISNTSTFSIMTAELMHVCGTTIITTEHSRLFIYEMSRTFVEEGRGRRRGKMIVENVDFTTYVNAKIVYVERHIRTQMETLYYELNHQRCQLERKVLRNLLSIALVKPDEFAYNLIEGPGHIAVITGEVVRVIKCLPVEVTILRTATCYLELPVLRNNQTRFLTPKTHILLRKGTEIKCNDAIPSTYKIADTWYEITPKAYKSGEPEILHPTITKTWKYEDPGVLATTGIYTQQELENL